MFFYNVMKETIRMKYVWLSILFLLNVSIIGCLFNYFETGIIKENERIGSFVQLAQRFDISTDELLTGQTSHPYKERITIIS